jgi:hypothetical protein
LRPAAETRIIFAGGVSMSQETIPVRLDGLVMNDDDVTPTLLNPLNGHIFVTNKVGKRVIEMCDGEKNVDDIVSGIGREFAGVTLDAIRDDVEKFLELALKNGVIIWRNRS